MWHSLYIGSRYSALLWNSLTRSFPIISTQIIFPQASLVDEPTRDDLLVLESEMISYTENGQWYQAWAVSHKDMDI